VGCQGYSFNPPGFSDFFDIKNERAYLVDGQPGKLKNIFEKILGRESMRWQSFVQAGQGKVRFDFLTLTNKPF
jgi:hypothetical protein